MLIWLKTVCKDVIVADVKVVIFVNVFSCCMSTLLRLYLKSFRNNERVDREENDDRNRSLTQGPSFPVQSVKTGSTKAALNCIVAARVINLQTGK